MDSKKDGLRAPLDRNLNRRRKVCSCGTASVAGDCGRGVPAGVAQPVPNIPTVGNLFLQSEQLDEDRGDVYVEVKIDCSAARGM